MLNYEISNNMLKIYNGFMTNPYDMEIELNNIRNKYNNYDILTRSNKSLIDEWKGHNLLYILGLFISHTQDVDLEYPQKWYFKPIYWILGKIFNFFYIIKSSSL